MEYGWVENRERFYRICLCLTWSECSRWAAAKYIRGSGSPIPDTLLIPRLVADSGPKDNPEPKVSLAADSAAFFLAGWGHEQLRKSDFRRRATRGLGPQPLEPVELPACAGTGADLTGAAQ